MCFHKDILTKQHSVEVGKRVLFTSRSALIWQKEASDKSDILVKEHNVSVISTDVNGISRCLT